MATYLLTWDPKKTGTRTPNLEDTWSCYPNRRKIVKGDRFYFMRLVQDPRGIIGSGLFLGNPKPGQHWQNKKKIAWYVDIKFDILELENEPVLPYDFLKSDSPFNRFFKNITLRRGSGVRIPDDIAEALEREWEKRTSSWKPLPEQIDEDASYPEGAKRKITVNAYERNSQARAACIKEHGHRCKACGMSFEEFYGEIGKDHIEVHHLKPLNKVGKNYKVDPIKDLIPVCPNCHSVIHLRKPPYNIKKVKRMINRGK